MIIANVRLKYLLRHVGVLCGAVFVPVVLVDAFILIKTSEANKFTHLAQDKLGNQWNVINKAKLGNLFANCYTSFNC